MLPIRLMVGELSVLEVNVQAARFSVTLFGLYNSIHSSVLEAAVPPQATSLMTMDRGGYGVAVAVGVGVAVWVFVAVGVSVAVGVNVSVGVRLGVGVSVTGVGVSVGTV